MSELPVSPLPPAAPTALPDTIPYASGLRAAPVETTLAYAEALAPKLGITRVTDITHLDRPGIPVAVSIRPGAHPDSLCVNGGKGVTKKEARVGAYMEAIEYALAEPGLSPDAPPLLRATPRDILDGQTRPEAPLDLCPCLGVPIVLDAPIHCVEAEVIGGGSVLIPAASVFLPAPEEPTAGESAPPLAFGFCSNGLASGNTILEATTHGLSELVERDIRSFQRLRSTETLVSPDTFPPLAAQLAGRLRNAGLLLWVRAVADNPFGVAYFSAYLCDPDDPSSVYFNSGFGCHPHRAIALTRAICEAAQSRLGFIHGGRDDLLDYYRRNEKRLAQDKDFFAPSRLAASLETGRVISYEDVPDMSEQATDIASCFEALKAAVAKVGATKILRARFTAADAPLQVVRIVVPLLEDFSQDTYRVGPRLREYVLAAQK